MNSPRITPLALRFPIFDKPYKLYPQQRRGSLAAERTSAARRSRRRALLRLTDCNVQGACINSIVCAGRSSSAVAG